MAANIIVGIFSLSCASVRFGNFGSFHAFGTDYAKSFDVVILFDGTQPAALFHSYLRGGSQNRGFYCGRAG